MEKLILVALLIGSIFLLDQCNKKDREELQAELNQYNNKIFYYLRHDSDLKSINIQGGVITIDLEKNVVTRLFKDIKKEYQPTSSDNVKTGVAYKCSKILVGNYTDNEPGYRNVCDIYLIDVNKHSWSFVGTINGSDPPDSKKGSGDREGSNPVRDYLKRVGLIG